VALLALRIKTLNSYKFKYFNKCFNILKKNFNVIVILFVLANLWFFHIGFISTKNPNELYPEPEHIVFLKNNSEGYRVYDVHDLKKHFPQYYLRDGGIPDNTHIIYGIYKVSSYNPIELSSYKEVLSCIHPLSDNTHHPILNLLNVKYILTSTPLNNSGFELVFNNETVLFQTKYDTYIYENKQVLPKAFVIHKVKLILSKEKVLRELKSESFNPIDAVILEQQPTSEILGNERNEGFEPAEIRTYSPNEIIVAINIPHPGYLVLSENYYPGWKAYVDGAQQEIHRAYHTLRAVYLDAGSHEVRFTFDPASLRIGAWITVLTSLLLVGTISMKRMMHLKLRRESQ